MLEPPRALGGDEQMFRASAVDRPRRSAVRIEGEAALHLLLLPTQEVPLSRSSRRSGRRTRRRARHSPRARGSPASLVTRAGRCRRRPDVRPRLAELSVLDGAHVPLSNASPSRLHDERWRWGVPLGVLDRAKDSPSRVAEPRISDGFHQADLGLDLLPTPRAGGRRQSAARKAGLWSPGPPSPRGSGDDDEGVKAARGDRASSSYR